MEFIDKFVEFNQFCSNCKNKRTPETEEPCNECLTSPVNEHSRKPIHYEEASNHMVGSFKTIQKKAPYFYETQYEELDTDYAEAHFSNNAIPGYCSAVRNGNLIGRNFDWTYNHQAEFLVRVPALSNRYASIGISSGLSSLTEEFVQTKLPSKLYKVVPFNMADGVNEYGVFAEINVVSNDFGRCYAVPLKSIRERVNSLMLVRYVLDHFKSAREAVDYLRDYVYISFPKVLEEMGYQSHWMIADRHETFIVEIIGNRLVYNQSKISTNFHVCSTIFNPDGTVYTPETAIPLHTPYDTNKITKYGSGLERWNHIVNNYYRCGTKAGMRTLMNELLYTKAYYGHEQTANPFWYSEFVGGPNFIYSPLSQLQETAEKYGQIFAERSRDVPNTWQSVHSVVYDLSDLSLSVIVQENTEKEMTFKLGE